jgi:hypothetical protein
MYGPELGDEILRLAGRAWIAWEHQFIEIDAVNVTAEFVVPVLDADYACRTVQDICSVSQRACFADPRTNVAQYRPRQRVEEGFRVLFPRGRRWRLCGSWPTAIYDRDADDGPSSDEGIPMRLIFASQTPECWHRDPHR